MTKKAPKAQKPTKKTRRALKKIVEDDDGYVPDGQFLDLDGEEDSQNPLNDKFFKDKRRLERLLNYVTARTKPAQRECAQRHMLGHKTSEIASELQITPSTVRTYIKLKSVQEYMSVLHQYKTLLSGFTTQHKEALLMRIAMANETERPSIAIAAVAESNRTMHHKIDREDRMNGFAPTQTTIIINPTDTPRTSLDDLPPMLAPQHTPPLTTP